MQLNLRNLPEAFLEFTCGCLRVVHQMGSTSSVGLQVFAGMVSTRGRSSRKENFEFTMALPRLESSQEICVLLSSKSLIHVAVVCIYQLYISELYIS